MGTLTGMKVFDALAGAHWCLHLRFAFLLSAEASVARNLVLCFDGANSEFAATNTNVVKLYAMLDRTKPDQLAYYPTGIGTLAPPGPKAKSTATK